MGRLVPLCIIHPLYLGSKLYLILKAAVEMKVNQDAFQGADAGVPVDRLVAPSLQVAGRGR